MKKIISLLLVVSWLQGFAQKRLSVSLENSFGLIQLQERELLGASDRNKYTPRYGIGLASTLRLFRSQLEIGAGLLYSWSNMPIFDGGPPLFPRGEGFPILNINNNHWEGRFFIQHPFIKRRKVQIGGLFGVDIGWPDFIRRAGSSHEGSSYNTFHEGFEMRLDYQVDLLNVRRSVALRSGINVDVQLTESIWLSMIANYRFGLVQSVGYIYRGEIYTNGGTTANRRGFEQVFFNSGVFLDVGLKWYW